jgi:carboxypeptidase Taq
MIWSNTAMSEDDRKSYAELIRLNKEISLLASCSAVLGWDERTYMPKGGASHRSEQHALLAGIVHERATHPVIGELLSQVEGSQLSRDMETDVNVREIRRGYDKMIKLPRKLVEEMARVTSLAEQAWEEARERSDFSHFLPHLESVVRLKREEAAALEMGDTAYDALLDWYEPGETAENLTRVLGALRDELVPLVGAIVDSGITPRRSVLEGNFPVELQEAFGKAAAKAIGFDFERGRLDVTVHPFCTGIGPGDTRITTRYDSKFFPQAFFGILHEAGHGLYEQGLDADHAGTPMGETVSLGIHESQSRMWENLVGRSRSFWTHFFPAVKEKFGMDGVDPDDFYFSINDVRPSLIRVEADEATYNLHILLRFELEQALISGDLPAKDLPGVWNETFERFFGMVPSDDAVGCMQDVHWGAGLIGYFPTYSLGNLYAAQFFEQVREDLGDLDEQFGQGEFQPLKNWLVDRIHIHGMRYPAPELVEQVTGRPLSHKPLMDHLRAKYGPLYGV